jgi:hypothetical protein
VAQARDGAGLVEEGVDQLQVAGELGQQHLQRHLAVGADVLGQVDAADAPLPDQPLHPIALGENTAHQRVGRVVLALALRHSMCGER